LAGLARRVSGGLAFRPGLFDYIPGPPEADRMTKRKLAIFLLIASAVFVASRGVQQTRRASASVVVPGAGAVASHR
jgi:hypothetical protein